MSKPLLAIGDVHGHLDRLEALLLQEGVIGDCHSCEGNGDVGSDGEGGDFMCENCDGTGIARINHDVEVIQLGDLGHFGSDTLTADELSWKFGPEWVDHILWGNHDRAVVASHHMFNGYLSPMPSVKERMLTLQLLGRLKLAHTAHGFLFTHAGLHASFKHNEVPEGCKNYSMLSQWLNRADLGMEDLDLYSAYGDSFLAIRDAIGRKRNGPSDAGGILWRDASESLYPEFRQIFGHSRGDKVRTYQGPAGDSYCIDVGDRYNGHLAGMWLPEERVVEVKLKGSYY